MPNTSDGHVQCGESKGKKKKKEKEKQFIKETVLRTTNTSSFQLSPSLSLSLSALFSIEIIQSERNVLCISQLKRNTTQSVKKKTFYTGIEILYGFNLIMAKKVLHLN